MTQHWTLDDIPWDQFDATKVDPELLKAVKAAAMVEYNAADYVGYLRKVFAGDQAALDAFERWGVEEVQHGAALARWAELADPSFKFEPAFQKFREGYRPPHFDSGIGRRGSRSGEMIARCVVESGTSSYYSAMRDAADEPVLKEIAARIAADEFAHYRLFLETMKAQREKQPSFVRRLWIAATRLQEADDDELAYAFYCANTELSEIGRALYDRKACANAYSARVMRMYRKHHIFKAMQMVSAAVGAHPRGWLPRVSSFLVWNYLRTMAARSAT